VVTVHKSKKGTSLSSYKSDVDIIGKVDGRNVRNGHEGAEAGQAACLGTGLEMAGQAPANDAQSQINVVDCFLHAVKDAVMFWSTRCLRLFFGQSIYQSSNQFKSDNTVHNERKQAAYGL